MTSVEQAAREGAELDPAGVVLRFLESVGRPAEARLYLDLFRARPREQFACIAVDGHVVENATDAVVLDLRFLAALGLTPTVVLGLFQPADAASHARRLRRRLAAQGVPSTVHSFDDADLAASVTRDARAAVVPIVTYEPGGTQDAGAKFDALGRLLAGIEARKLIFLHRPGGLRQAGAPVPVVNLSADVPALLASRELSRKEAIILEQSRRLVLDSQHGLVVAVTGPLNLLRELFTVKGAGTLMRRGATILRHDGWDGVDRARVRALLEASFGRAPSESFFERAVARTYLEDAYRGVAIVVDTPLGAYLTKFAVTPEAQGEGIARELWDEMARDNPVVFWRARPGNSIVPWYERLCDGLERTADWHVYWKGLAHERIPEAIAFALAQPVDMG